MPSGKVLTMSYIHLRKDCARCNGQMFPAWDVDVAHQANDDGGWYWLCVQCGCIDWAFRVPALVA